MAQWLRLSYFGRWTFCLSHGHPWPMYFPGWWYDRPNCKAHFWLRVSVVARLGQRQCPSCSAETGLELTSFRHLGEAIDSHFNIFIYIYILIGKIMIIYWNWGYFQTRPTYQTFSLPSVSVYWPLLACRACNILSFSFSVGFKSSKFPNQSNSEGIPRASLVASCLCLWVKLLHHLSSQPRTVGERLAKAQERCMQIKQLPAFNSMCACRSSVVNDNHW